MTDSTRRDLRVGDRTASMHLATPAQPGGGGVLVYHAWWGLNEDVIAFADRLADATGQVVAAPDLFDGQVAKTVEEADRISSSADEDTVDAIALAASDALTAIAGGPDSRLGAVGFSFGGAWALWLPAQRPNVVATVVYYGSIEGPSLTRTTVPVLGHFAETDPYESEEGLAAFESTLRGAGREVAIHRYPGTGHWFAEPSKTAYERAAANLAFDRTVEFLKGALAAD